MDGDLTKWGAQVRGKQGYRSDGSKHHDGHGTDQGNGPRREGVGNDGEAHHPKHS